MTIFLPTLAVAFAAFCVWLTVRIINRGQQAIDLAIGLALTLVPIVMMVAGVAILAIIWNFAPR